MSDPKEFNILQDLKEKLDGELDKDQHYQMLQLIKRHLGPLYETYLMNTDWMPSDLLECLENNMPESHVLTILLHVFGEMQLHNTTTFERFTDYISKYFAIKGCFYHADLIGRKKELEDIKRELGKQKGVWVYGQGGLGKTTLVNELCTLMSYREKLPVKKVNLKETFVIGDMLKQIIKQFNASFMDDDQEAVNIDTVAVCLKETLKHETRDTLLFLDNVENVYENDEKNFPSTISSLIQIHTNIKWIMTSRLPLENMEGLCQYTLDPMSPKDAETLLEMSCRPKYLPECQKMSVLAKCGNVPLAIKTVAVALVSDSEHNITLSKEELDHRLRSSLSGTFKCLEYAFNQLATSSKHSLRILAIVGTIPIDIECVGTLLNLSQERTNRLMSELILRQFVQPEPPASGDFLFDSRGVRYSLHPLIVQFVKDWLSGDALQPELLINAEKYFCMYIQNKIHKMIGKVDKNYTQAVTAVQQNSEILQRFFEIVPSIDVRDIKLTEDEGAHVVLGQVVDLVKMSPKGRSSFYDRFSKRFMALNDHYSYCFWQLETMKALLVAKDCREASRVSDDIEHHLPLVRNPDMQKSINANYLFQKGRLLRLRDVTINETAVIKLLNASMEICRGLVIRDPSIKVLISSIENVKGNVCFDVHKYDEAYEHHAKAAEILEQYTGNSDHPYLTVYEFNKGTVLFQKAETLLQDESLINEQLRTYYLEALDIFNQLIERDRKMGRHYQPQFEAKLSYRAKLFERLSRFKEALDDRNDVLQLVADYFPKHTKVTDAKFMKALTLDSWIQKLPLGDERKQKLNQMIETLMKVHDCILDNFPLSDRHKSKFLNMYRRVADNMPHSEKPVVLSFCKKYESNEHFDSYSDSDSSESDFSSENPQSESDNDSGTEEPMETSDAPHCITPTIVSLKRQRCDTDSDSDDSIHMDPKLLIY